MAKLINSIILSYGYVAELDTSFGLMDFYLNYIHNGNGIILTVVLNNKNNTVFLSKRVRRFVGPDKDVPVWTDHYDKIVDLFGHDSIKSIGDFIKA